MNYLSVCSGVEAATVAWHPLGFEPVGYSEIEPFPSAVLAHHYPNVKNFGDMTNYKEWEIGTTRLDILVGGTPCQSFSVAGLRKGLEDPRGNLALIYCGLLDKFRPKWFVWENVPGVLSSNGGRDFGSFLGAVAELGYGFSYRVLDAQYFGVAQRRRRVFVVGCLGDWRSAAKVLFEPSSLSRDTAPSREARKKATSNSGIGVEISGPIAARDYKDVGTDGLNEISAKMIAVPYAEGGFADYRKGFGTVRRSGGTLGGGSETLVTFDRQSNCQYSEGEIASTVSARDYKSATDLITKVYENHPSDSRVQEMGDVCSTVTRRWGTGGGNVPFAVQAFDSYNLSLSDTNQTIKSPSGGTLESIGGIVQSVSIEPGASKRLGGYYWEEISSTLRADMGDNQTAVAYSVREDAKANTFSATELEVANAIGALRPSPQSHHAQTFIAIQDVNPRDKKQNGKGWNDEGLSYTVDTHATQGVARVVAPTLTASNDPSRSPQSTEVTNQIASVYAASMGVRRLTPTETERLQGFPDGYTQIPWKGKASPDSARYKAMGNSMAVPVMAWIGKRIQEVENENS